MSFSDLTPNSDRIEGATDGTQIGNVGDALKVSSSAAPAIVDSTNSTSTPLAGNATYTGAWIDVLGYTNISVLVYTDQNSAEDGLLLQFSSDGVNIDESDTYKIPLNTGKQYTAGIVSQYFRVVYNNGLVSQSEFRLQTIIHPSAPKPSSHRLNSELSGEDDAELVKSVLAAKDEYEHYHNINASHDGHLLVESVINKHQQATNLYVLKGILKELKVITGHLEVLTEVEVSREDRDDIDNLT